MCPEEIMTLSAGARLAIKQTDSIASCFPKDQDQPCQTRGYLAFASEKSLTNQVIEEGFGLIGKNIALLV